MALRDVSLLLSYLYKFHEEVSEYPHLHVVIKELFLTGNIDQSIENVNYVRPSTLYRGVKKVQRGLVKVQENCAIF